MGTETRVTSSDYGARQLMPSHPHKGKITRSNRLAHWYLRQREELHELAKQEVSIRIVSGQILLKLIQILRTRPTFFPLSPKIPKHPHYILDPLVNSLQVRSLGM